MCLRLLLVSHRGRETMSLWLKLSKERAARIKRCRGGGAGWRCTRYVYASIANMCNIQFYVLSLDDTANRNNKWRKTSPQQLSPALRLKNSAVSSGKLKKGECEQSSSSVLKAFPLFASACATMPFCPSIERAWSLEQNR
jgi:hypothetical protein